jgi:hypothetical protein
MRSPNGKIFFKRNAAFDTNGDLTIHLIIHVSFNDDGVETYDFIAVGDNYNNECIEDDVIQTIKEHVNYNISFADSKRVKSLTPNNMTIENLLLASNAFEGRKNNLTKALNCVKASQKAYARFLRLSQLAKEESSILNSAIGYRIHPLVTVRSKNDWERKASIAKRWSERQIKKADCLMTEFLTGHISIEKLF